ncbi:hypothetical protein GCM10010441_61880 [Kitasatospora paracochleata]
MRTRATADAPHRRLVSHTATPTAPATHNRLTTRARPLIQARTTPEQARQRTTAAPRTLAAALPGPGARAPGKNTGRADQDPLVRPATRRRAASGHGGLVPWWRRHVRRSAGVTSGWSRWSRCWRRT